MTQDWAINGDYAEACNCEVACQCVWLEPPDDDVCTVSLVWDIKDGQYGDVDLSGRKVAMLAHSDEGVMFAPDTGWYVALVIDDEADDDQRAALEDIYLGRAGGIWAAVADTHFESTEVATAPITFSQDDDGISSTVGDVVTMDVVEKAGFNEDLGTVSPHPLAKGMEAKTGKLRTATVSYDDEFAWDVSGSNSYFSEFDFANA